MTATPFLTILVAGVLANGIWRMCGAMLSSGLTDDSLWIRWAQAMSRALIAGLAAKVILFPPGALAGISAPLRVGTLLLGVAIFYAARRNLTLGIGCGTGALVIAHLAGG